MFDASKIYEDVPLSAAGDASRRLEHFNNPTAFPVRRQQLERDLKAIEYRLNMLAWSHYVSDLPAPTPEEGSELLKRFPEFDKDAIEAATLRYLLENLTRLEGEAKVEQEREWVRTANANAEKEDREAFDAFEASEREKRFQAWRRRR